MSQIQKSPTLKQLLADPALTIQQVAAHLDALTSEERIKQCMALGLAPQRRLFELAKDAPCTVEDFVPANTPPFTEVIHEGKNTLPLFSRFQKRFAKANSDDTQVFGYNEGFTRRFIGPGYFVAHPTTEPPSEAHWPTRSPYVVNYFMVPTGEVVPGWPKVVPNSKGLQRFVYNGMRDYMRKIAEGVTIGEAYQGDKSFNSYFLLVRH